MAAGSTGSPVPAPRVCRAGFSVAKDVPLKLEFAYGSPGTSVNVDSGPAGLGWGLRRVSNTLPDGARPESQPSVLLRFLG